jgi:hypothetical protein
MLLQRFFLLLPFYFLPPMYLLKAAYIRFKVKRKKLKEDASAAVLFTFYFCLFTFYLSVEHQEHALDEVH